MDQPTILDIERDGLESSGGNCEVSSERQARHQDYLKHLERMRVDDDYRYKWEQNEREYQEARKRHYYY